MSAGGHYTVTANRLNLRSEPGIDSRVLAVIAGGTAVVPDGDLAAEWWHVATQDARLAGYVARRYLAPVSSALPHVENDAVEVLWALTERCAGRVSYELGAKLSAQGRIDCSGWVCELTQAAFSAINAAAAPEVVFERSDFAALVTHSDGIVSGIERRTGFVLHGAQVTAAALRPGMLIGMDYGAHTWELGHPPRVYGIDHIVQVVAEPGSGRLYISQSSSWENGVNRVPLADWLGAAAQAKLRAQNRMHAVDPFLMADRNTAFVGLTSAVKALEVPVAPVAPPSAPALAVATNAALAISAAASDLVVGFEVGSRAYYERALIHPIWPQAGSGITIGIGHDLGYTTKEAFARNWAGLSASDRARLSGAIGKRGAAAKALLGSLRDIRVPWTLAEGVYRKVDIPEMIATTTRVLPNCERLAPDCLGALVSLSFNRGASYATARKATDTIDRYREMRAIRALMAAGQFSLVSAQIRAMKRIWRGTTIEGGMNRRRDAEADLFDAGIKAMEAAEAIRAAAASAGKDELIPEVLPGVHAEKAFPDEGEEEAVAAARAAPPALALDQADLVARARVVWASDDKAIDYAHLRSLPPPGTRFTLRAEDLARLHALNHFPADFGGGPAVLFGLRGCGIVQGGGGLLEEAVLVDQRPDHASARCVMGVWDRAQGRIAVFPASTVPNAKAVTGWQATRKSGNLLPTGFYGYITGTHNEKPGCLLLRKSLGEPRVVVVRRSSNDLRYERADIADPCAPGDNIHPSFYATSEAGFSSFGCQVVVGKADRAGNHTGPWAKFREAMGLPAHGARDGQGFGYMLLTGAEANLASALRRSGVAGDAGDWASLHRLRFGSQGDEVRRLQAVLGLPDPDGDFGRNTSDRFHARQRELLEGNCDGICSPELAKAAGWSIFT
ncbi:hypothetical protein HT136_20270 [Novosphingobium profundi]|uniref:SH3 domain-containing protein n=1 Tax=Novosphingobium profundi TaxID=1774954 RepID=UPI001BD9A9FC|nr:SH3 domain-containing protein [Novosphingobium profundi]MBT0670707.1 hypothetical protein [Novosphingobium profundi]